MSPLPIPKKGESQNDFVSRCVSFETHASPDREHEQVVAMCFTRWREFRGGTKLAFFDEETNFNKQDLKLWRKPILAFGRWKHPENQNVEFEITPDVVLRIIKNFKSGVPVEAPVLLTHTDNPKAKVGVVKDLVMTSEGLDAVLSVEDEEINKKIEGAETTPGVSCWLDLDYEDKKTGEKRGAVVKHVAFVNHPYLEGLGGFQTVSLLSGAEKEDFTPLFLSEKKKFNSIGDGDMPKELTKDEVLKFLGEKDNKAAVLKFLKEKADVDVETLLSDSKALKELHEKIDKGELLAKEDMALLSDDLLSKIKEELKLGDDAKDVNAVVKSLLEKVMSMGKTLGEVGTELSEMKAETRIKALLSDGFAFPAEKETLKELFLTNFVLFDKMEKSRRESNHPFVVLGETGVVVSEELKTKEKEEDETIKRNVEAAAEEGYIEKK